MILKFIAKMCSIFSLNFLLSVSVCFSLYFHFWLLLKLCNHFLKAKSQSISKKEEISFSEKLNYSLPITPSFIFYSLHNSIDITKFITYLKCRKPRRKKKNSQEKHFPWQKNFGPVTNNVLQVDVKWKYHTRAKIEACCSIMSKYSTKNYWIE